MTPAVEGFDRHRRLLFSVAYQMLGSVADAEDVVQDAWLRWTAADRGGGQPATAARRLPAGTARSSRMAGGRNRSP